MSTYFPTNGAAGIPDVDELHDEVGKLLQRECFQPSQSEVFSVDRALRAMTSKRWRKSQLSEVSRADLTKKLQAAEAAVMPITFSIPFGCYKSWRVASSPLPNWAEVFALRHLRSFAESVQGSWAPGIRLEFTYIDGVMDLVSNHNPEWQSVYASMFGRFCDWFSTDNISFVVTDVASVEGLAAEDVRELVLNRFEEIQRNWSASLSLESQGKKIESARRNFRPWPGQSVTEEDYLRSAMLCDALDSLDLRRNYNKFSSRIQLVYVRGPEPALHIGTVRSGGPHFWVSEGIVLYRHGLFEPRVVGHSASDELLRLPAVDTRPIVPSALAGPGVERIRVAVES